MKIIYYEFPAPHVVIDDFYTQDELEDVHLELEFLSNSRNFESPEKTLSALKNGVSLKKNSGVFLDDIFARRSASNILVYNRKLFNQEFTSALIPCHFVFKYLDISQKERTIVSYYQDEDYYQPHFDAAMLSVCVWLFKQPRRFSGGDFNLSDYNYKIPIENNRCIIFPSVLKHSVDTIKMHDPNEIPFSCNGRYVITTFVG